MSNFNSADIAAFKDVWVFCEQREGKLMPTDFELISKGRDLANELGVNLCGLLLGGEGIESAAKELGGHGADKVPRKNTAKDPGFAGKISGKAVDHLLFPGGSGPVSGKNRRIK